MNSAENISSRKQFSGVTLAGIPLRFELQWPAHRSTSGADFHVVHGTAWLLSDPAGTLHAEFAANISQTMVEALPSLEPQHAEVVVINAARISADSGRVEFLKSGKRLPVEVSSRYLNFKTSQIRFLNASNDDLRRFIERKVFWLGGGTQTNANTKVAVADAYDCAYLGASEEKFMSVAESLRDEGLLKLVGELASATPLLIERESQFQADLQKALDRAVAKFNQALTG